MFGFSRSLVASATQVTTTNGATIGRLGEAWQSRAFGYYNRVGEIHYAAQFYAKGLSRVRFFPAMMNDKGEAEEVTDGKLLEIFNRMKDPGGGRTEMQAEYGRLRFLVGEAYLLITPEDNDKPETWEIVSKDELRIGTGGAVSRIMAPGLTGEELKLAEAGNPSDKMFKPQPGETSAFRLWRKHPQYSALADAPMRSVLDVCEELVALTDSVRARIRSRLAGAGILFIAEELGLPGLEPTGDENAKNDPFMNDMIAAATAAITNQGSAEAVVPIIARVKSEFLENGKGYAHLKIHDPKDTYPETGLRDEAIRRLALGLDLPPEILLGMTDANHWSGWLVDEQVWKAHLWPIADEFASEMAQAWFRPEAEKAEIPGWERVCIGIDPADVVNHPDRSPDAKDLQKQAVISDAATRAAAGFSEKDAPTDEEMARYIGIKTGDSSLAMYGVPSVSSVPAEAPADGTAPPQDQTGGGTDAGPPDQSASANVPAAHTLAVLLQGAAEAAVERCRELAGAKLRSKATCKTKPCEECTSLINGVANAKVASALGFDRANGLNAPSAPRLVAGGAELFVSTARRLGCPGDFATILGELIENHAAHTLYDSRYPRLPAGFIGILQRGRVE